MSIIIHLDVMMAKRKMKNKDLAARVGISPINLSRIKTGKIKSIRFSTLAEICKVLDCQPGDIMEYKEETLEGLKRLLQE